MTWYNRTNDTNLERLTESGVITMKRYALIPALALTAFAVPLSAMPVASASFGTGIGVSFPTSGSHSSEIVPSYAAFSFDSIVEELTVEEKHGRLVMELKVTNSNFAPAKSLWPL